MNLFINNYQKNTRGHIFTINECQLVYFCIFLKAYCCFVRIQKYSFMCAATEIKHLRGRTVKSKNISYILQGVLGSILSDVNFFSFLFFTLFSLIPLKVLVYILLQALRFI